MKVCAFTGTSNADMNKHRLIVRDTVSKLKGFDEYVTGAAHGIDTLAAQEAYEYFPEANHRIVVPQGFHNHIHVQLAMVAKNIEIEFMPLGTGYRERNQRMIDLCDHLVAFDIDIKKEKFRGSGTWMTIRMAKEKPVPVQLVELDQ